jgi:hypothetical protein
MTGPGQQHTDLVEIARRNGDFKKNWGILIGAILYVRSLNAALGPGALPVASIARESGS